jgi:oligopeptide/dipeptide ABC transporter ATP-binding protein
MGQANARRLALRADDIILAGRHLTTIVGGHRRFLGKPQPPIRAVDDVSLAVRRGETFGVVGESGCGKTTLGRTLVGLLGQSEGEIFLDGRRADKTTPRRARRLRRDMQFLHQDAAAALDPWWSIGRSLAEPLAVHGMRAEAAARIAEILPAVGLDPALLGRYPHQLSGGQAKRVVLARLLMLRPKILVLDEPTSGLDLSIQAAVLRLLVELKQRFGLTTIFISHDLSVVRLVCDRVAVMYLGRIVETADAARLFAAPRHPYTRMLIAATPKLTPRAHAAPPIGDPPAMQAGPAGCAFRARCPHAIDLCAEQRPVLEPVGTGDFVACHRWRAIAEDAMLPA